MAWNASMGVHRKPNTVLERLRPDALVLHELDALSSMGTPRPAAEAGTDEVG